MTTRLACKLTAGLFLVLVLGAKASAQDAAKAAEAGQGGQSIDLPSTLKLAGANNLDLALVRQSLVQAAASDDAAILKFIPWVTPGIGHTVHHGALQDVTGNMLETNKQLYSNSAAFTAQVDLGAAIFEKLVASQNLSAAASNFDASKNDTTSSAAYTYFELVNAAANVEIAQEAVRISQDYENQVGQAVTLGLTNKSDQIRVSVQTQEYQIALRQRAQALRSTAANLAQILHLDVKAPLTPVDKIAPDITLIPLDSTLDSLVSEALAKRPELKGSAASMAAADWQRDEAIYGPLVPTVSAQAVYGQIRGGIGDNLSNLRGAQDYGLMLNWRIGPGGLFDFSRIDMADSKLEQSHLSDTKLRDEITRQVVTAYEGVQSASDQGKLAQSSLELAQQSLTLSQQRKEFGVAAILEVIQAQKDFTQARIDFARAHTQYAEAQYALARAVARMGN